MSSTLDLSQFFETFFDEADELLAQMEQLLLDLDLASPDIEQLNAIFRCAHSIKGGAATFGCFEHLAQTTHLLENLLDEIRRGDRTLRADMIETFLQTKDALKFQLDAYRASETPDEAAFERCCEMLRNIAADQAPLSKAPETVSCNPAVNACGALVTAAATASSAPPTGDLPVLVRIVGAFGKDAALLIDEMGNLGEVLGSRHDADGVQIWMQTTCSPDDIEAVCCFIVDAANLSVTRAVYPGEAGSGGPTEAGSGVPAEVANSSAPAANPPPSRPGPASGRSAAPAHADKESSSIRVGVEKIDQVINLVGELVITQAMLAQIASTLDPVLHDRLLNGMEQLDRNARDLQESVMSIRMMPMDYVFGRFPRLVRDLASKTGKKIELQTVGRATELDKGLIERIIDPLTHLVRNSLDHGIETPEKRIAAGKELTGKLVLSAQHSGGNIVIEVSDDGAGLSRERILRKAMDQGIAVNENASDEEVWQLIFAPGFSTAEKVTDISGRGVGMDVVRRNIQAMGGHVQLSSACGRGTVTRIVLPLTLAILDGMSVKVGADTFILPLSHVTESMQPGPGQIYSVAGDDSMLLVRGEYLPLVAMHRVFGVADAQTDPTRAIAVVMQAQDTRFALLVDHLIGQHQVVVKNLESNYRKVFGISAATILGDGSVALIVDAFALSRANRQKWAQSETVMN